MVGVRFAATEVNPGLIAILCGGSAVVTPAVDVAQDIAASPAHAPDRPAALADESVPKLARLSHVTSPAIMRRIDTPMRA